MISCLFVLLISVIKIRSEICWLRLILPFSMEKIFSPMTKLTKRPKKDSILSILTQMTGLIINDLFLEFLLESSRNAQIRHLKTFHISWFCRFCVTVFVQTALPRNLADRCGTCVWRQPCPHCRPSLHCWPLPPNLKRRRYGNRGATRMIALH